MFRPQDILDRFKDEESLIKEYDRDQSEANDGK